MSPTFENCNGIPAVLGFDEREFTEICMQIGSDRAFFDRLVANIKAKKTPIDNSIYSDLLDKVDATDFNIVQKVYLVQSIIDAWLDALNPATILSKKLDTAILGILKSKKE